MRSSIWVERVAYRPTPQEKWRWFGLPVYHFIYLNNQQMMLEAAMMIIETYLQLLYDRFADKDEFTRNVKLYRAETKEALDKIDLNEVDSSVESV